MVSRLNLGADKPNAARVEFRSPKPDHANEEGGVSAELRYKTTYAALGIARIVAICLSVLWLRVALESVIVLFNISVSLRSIDKKTK